MGKYCWLGTCAVFALAVHSREARAQDVDCLAEIGDDVVRGNLQVAGPCTLAGTDVRGNVILFSGGSLTARTAHIRGNLEGSRADFVDIERSRVDGNVQLEGLVGDASSIELTAVRGDVQLTGNRSHLEILNNDLGADLHVFRNLGGLLISGNAIEDDLRCMLNMPAPLGIGNRVEDETDGQCEDLQPEPAPPEPPPTPSPTPPPAPTPPPTSSPPPADSPPATELAPDEGGAGAIGWLVALLLPLLARRRLARAASCRRTVPRTR